ncbi:MAG TPA: hypothetical protein DCO75_04545 [Fibrobacteres bacterium]|nr:hypothetical protein [Fibrobacterota bacterium]
MYFLSIYAPLSGVSSGPTGRTFARKTGRPFLFVFKNLSIKILIISACSKNITNRNILQAIFIMF